jgi:ABC-type multidrug transport system permease subunit
MNSRINSIFMSVLFMCVSSQNTVLAVFETERNMFYRHRNAKMYGTGAIVRAFTFAEIPFILMSSTAFTLIFYFFLGYVAFLYTVFPSYRAHFLIPLFISKIRFAKEADKFFLFYLFVTLGLGSFTMIGQMLVALFRDSQTAQGFGGLFISMTSLFSGILIRPNNIPSFWIFL